MTWPSRTRRGRSLKCAPGIGPERWSILAITGASSDAQAPTPTLHASIPGPGRPRSALRPEEPGRGRPAAQAEARTDRQPEGHRLEGLETLTRGGEQRDQDQVRMAE